MRYLKVGVDQCPDTYQIVKTKICRECKYYSGVQYTLWGEKEEIICKRTVFRPGTDKKKDKNKTIQYFSP